MADDRSTLDAVLDPVERATEVIFGVLMAVSITGTHSVVASRPETREMLATALGCNLAWGFCDGAMYLVAAATEKARRRTLLRRLHAAADPAEGRRLLAGAYDDRVPGGISEPTLERLRERMVALPLSVTSMDRRDLAGALGVFVLVVLATFPVALPFVFLDEGPLAMRLSNLAALVTLYANGHLLGRYAGGRPWLFGLGVTAIGVLLVAVVIALGG